MPYTTNLATTGIDAVPSHLLLSTIVAHTIEHFAQSQQYLTNGSNALLHICCVVLCQIVKVFV